MNRLLLGSVVLVAMMAMMAGVVVLYRRQPDTARSIAALSARVDQLSLRVAAAQVTPRFVPVPLPAGTSPALAQAVNGSLEELARRITVLEERLKGPDGQPQAPSRPERPPSEASAAARAVAVDTSAPLPQRIRALQALRATNQRTREVTQSMIDLLSRPEVDAHSREEIIKHLHGVEFEELKAPLLGVLGSDQDPGIKAEAVETLSVFLNDPKVYEAVARLRDKDPAEPVRAEAARRLARFDARGAAAGRQAN
jgi:hypothetical protein